MTRTVAIPDSIRPARCDVSRVLIEYTHNSIHLITPFDSGGSSADLREAFGMISVGDLRNRIMALTDTKLRGHPEIYRLFGHRLPAEGDPVELRQQLERTVAQPPKLLRHPGPPRLRPPWGEHRSWPAATSTRAGTSIR